MSNKHTHKHRKPRQRRGPSTGLVAVSAVLLAASASASAAVQGTEAADVTEQPQPEPTLAEAGAGGGSAPSADFPDAIIDDHRASGRFVSNAPAVLTAGIPSTVLDAYERAHARSNLVQPNCHIPLELLAAIGKVESGHARGGLVDQSGQTLAPILGPVLDGGAFAAIGDTDGGRLDGDTTWDRAVGPMQFIPGTWARWAADGNADGTSDPHNIYDASLAAARYLCAANRDLGTPAGLDEGVLSYNHSTSYLALVRSWMAIYSNGAISIEDIAGTEPPFDSSAQGAMAAERPSNPPTPSEPVAATPPSTTPPPTTPPTTTPPPTPVPPREPADPLPTPTTPPTTESTPPSSNEAADPSTSCEEGTGTLGLVGGLVGGLLGGPSPDDADCVQELELSSVPAAPQSTLTTTVPAPPA